MESGNQKANCVLSCIKNNVTSRLKKVILSLYSALMRTHMEYCFQFWGLQHKKNVDLLGQVQRRVTNMNIGLEHPFCEDRWIGLGLFSLEKRMLWRFLIGAFQCLKGAYRKAAEEYFTSECSTWRHGIKLKEYGFALVVRKKFFTIKVVRDWNRLPREVVDAPSLEVFKARLNGALSSLV
ncbi:hypothetical protein WISP_24066 [Willisornis vidua]|uniref:Uncharacterized protein n=1 Tax=Willisornis vidua TaxID=1566151 RepID=A0ABQ9DT29_9PASS|nr:hypothetical protein WISP_24066 [Willisornis vidua]